MMQVGCLARHNLLISEIERIYAHLYFLTEKFIDQCYLGLGLLISSEISLFSSICLNTISRDL